ncbi:MAG: cyclodeaminase/cyclohydrolase family protein, partial [Desulfobacterales bacterium]|jgi:glutamate formiminotransferase/formiminotetrahydrofolate cyclodeaminase
VWATLCEVARHGNISSKSDIQVGARALETGIWGAYQNILINMTGVKDDAFRQDILAEADAMAARAGKKCREVLDILEDR